MGLALTIASRSLKGRPGRTFFSALGIALGIATVVGVVTLDFNTIVGMTKGHQLAGDPDLEVRPKPGGAPDATELLNVDGVSTASAFFQNDAHALKDPGQARAERVRLIALESEMLPLLGVYSLLAGRDLAAAQPEVLVGSELAEKLDLELGDSLMLSRPRRSARKECVDGQLAVVGEEIQDDPQPIAFEVVGVLAREKLGRRSKGMVCLVDFAWGKELYRGMHVNTRYWAKRDPNVDLERLQASLSQRYSFEMNQSVVIGQAADERAFRTGVRMAGLLALVLGLYVIFHTLSMSLAERMHEVGGLHALGVTRGQIARTFLLEAVILAGMGAFMGLVGGIGLAGVLLKLGITTLGSGKYVRGFVIPWDSVVPLALVGFVIALVGSVYPLMRIGATNTVAVLRGEADVRKTGAAKGFQFFFGLLLAIILPGLYLVLVPVVGEFERLIGVLLAGVGFLALLIALPLFMPSVVSGVCRLLTGPFSLWWPFAGRVSARTMTQGAARIAVSASAIALVAAGLVGLKGMTRSLHGEVEEWSREAVADKVWIKDMPDVRFDQFRDHLRTYPGVVGVELGNARTYGQFLLIGTDPDELAGYGPCAEDPVLLDKLATGRGIILSRRLAKDLQYEVGDLHRVGKPDGTTATFEIVAITDAYGYFPHPDERLYGVIAADTLQRAFCVNAKIANEVAVRLAPDADRDIVSAATNAYLSEHVPAGVQKVGFETGAQLIEHHVMDIDRDFILFDILIGLTAALAALGVLNGQLLAALERAKEIGVFKALGVTRRQVAGMVLLESTVVGLVGGTIGVALGSALGPVVVGALEDVAGLTLPQRSAGPWIVLAALGSVGLTVLAGLYPIWRMNRFDAVRAVRTG